MLVMICWYLLNFIDNCDFAVYLFGVGSCATQSSICFNIITVHRPIRIIISPRLTDFGSLPKYESNPRRCFELCRSSLRYRMLSVDYKRNATKSKSRQRVVKCEVRDQPNCGMELEKKVTGEKTVQT